MSARIGCALSLLLSATCLSQSPQVPQSAPAGAPQIRTGTQLVVVDVVVQDSAGHPVRNLPRDAFQVTENKSPQSITTFEEHSAGQAKPSAALPRLPPGTFTNYTPVPAGGALNILLVDALNTPMLDQDYLRNQLKEYVNKAQPGGQVAIFGLNSRLYMLQGFTTNPEVLKDAINHKLSPRGSHLMDDALTNTADSPATVMADRLAAMGDAETASNVLRFENIDQYELDLRLQFTLDAFNALAHYLSAFPGRKNLLWFSGSFPVKPLPDALMNDPFALVQTRSDEFRETTLLLARSQVAVYPIDARGLMSPPTTLDSPGPQYRRDPNRMNSDHSKFFQSQADEHATMEQMAADTGGRAFYNSNGLAEAVATALDSGSSYYTLAYHPEDRNTHGEYRSIRVNLTGPHTAGLKLSYRHGYYTDGPAPPPGTPSTAHSADASAMYNRSAMLHGAPAPEDIIFKARILPASGATDAALLPQDRTDPASPFKGPYRRYSIDFAAFGHSFRLVQQQPGGHYTGAVEFQVDVYDRDGKLLNLVARTVNLDLTAEAYKQMLASPVNLNLQVSAPARGESYLRLGIHDLSTNRYGALEVSTAGISHLPPESDPASKQQ